MPSEAEKHSDVKGEEVKGSVGDASFRVRGKKGIIYKYVDVFPANVNVSFLFFSLSEFIHYWLS